MRMCAGKVMMDRNCPENLQDTAQQSYEDSQALIDQWHGDGRLSYAVTPRFAPTSSREQLAFAGKLFNDNRDVYLQSHVAENRAEVEWVAELFPDARSYLDVYDQFGLLGERAVYAHCIHLDATDRARMRESGTRIAFCPTSNLFLGSGLFDIVQAKEGGVMTSLATDIGGGTSFSMFQTAHEAYKVTRMAGRGITPAQMFYEMTLGGARALSLEHEIGNFQVGKIADFVVIDPAAIPLLSMRLERCESALESMFSMMVLADDRATRATYINGVRRYDSDGQ